MFSGSNLVILRQIPKHPLCFDDDVGFDSSENNLVFTSSVQKEWSDLLRRNERESQFKD